MSQISTDDRSGRTERVSAPDLDISVKSIRETASPDDGRRILVNRFWPLGVSRMAAALAEWHADWAPSWPLRQWFDDSEERWATFCARYREELNRRGKMAEVRVLAALSRRERVTLVYTGANRDHNVAVALLRIIRES